jgi:hypothetical protein
VLAYPTRPGRRRKCRTSMAPFVLQTMQLLLVTLELMIDHCGGSFQRQPLFQALPLV